MYIVKKIIKYFFIGLVLSLTSFWLAGKMGNPNNHWKQFLQKNEIIEPLYQKIFPCQRPKEYSIGKIDPRFKISREEFTKLTLQAMEVWNKAMGKKLLEYNPQTPFKINLIFDQRQQMTIARDNLQENLKTLKYSHDQISQKHNYIYNNYQKEIFSYKKNLKSYQKKLKEYNEEVAKWNDQGGAPKKVYDELQDEKNNLRKLNKNLEKQRTKINKLVEVINNLVSQEKDITNQYNTKVETYKSKFGGSREFEKGVFDGKEINIYQFREESDLRLTLTHEMGHYLGLQHVSNPKSIMYYLIGDQNMNKITPTLEDRQELAKVCQLKVIN